MRQINLYKYGKAVTPRRRNADDPVYAYRLVADTGMRLTNGEAMVYCVDVMPEDVNDWSEVSAEDE